ncbi:hypothetical protein AWC38_SpisGene10297 [Stylophora pistillata]|uniref:Integrase zinc-binding domain-containing protein n=1 Tax=Stylophora pistillata TaxID=50429 RepID=A0A2B4S6R7_STYPI|nr:hypothetical protein AWC38_SpisGene10297 [Stylophora pistillata]
MKKKRADAEYRKKENIHSMQRYNNIETIKEKKKKAVAKRKMPSLEHAREIDKQSNRKRKVENPEHIREIAKRSLRKQKAENPEHRKKINTQSFKKRKVKNSEPISQIKRNYVKVKKTVRSVHGIAQCAKMQYQSALPTIDSYDLQAQKNEHSVISMINLFHNNIKCGPEYICTCRDQLWYTESSVVKCDVNKYKDLQDNILTAAVDNSGSIEDDSDGWCEVDECPSGSTDTQEPDVGENANIVISFAPGEGNKPLGKNNPDNSRRLQLLIQHCYGKAREAIESCVNLPVEEGYYVAKNTLREDFGTPHIIARAPIKKLENLPLLKQAVGQSLLEFARHLEVAERTLTSMGPEYVSDLNHTNTLRKLNRKLLLFMRVKWTECAGRIIKSGQRPRFLDFLQFFKQRATLVNNEFGEDLNCSPSRDKEKGKGRDGRNRTPHKFTTMAIGARNDRSPQHKGLHRTTGARPGCAVCSNRYGVWRCGKFIGLPYQDKMKIVQENSLCIKCLNVGHYARIYPRTNLKCQKEGCNKEHNTLLHPPTSKPDGGSTSQSQLNRKGLRWNTIDSSNSETSNQDGVNVTAATGAGERVCLRVVPLKVKVKGSDLLPVETYALLYSESTVTLCHEHLLKKLGVSGPRLNFTLSGMTGSTRVERQLLDIVERSMYETVSVELPNVRTVKQMQISSDCIVKEVGLTRWSHLCDIELQELGVGEVMLVIGLKEKPSLFLPQEYKAGGEDEPVAVRYSLGWTVTGPVHGQKDDPNCSANFTRTRESSIVYDNVPVLREEHVCLSPIEGRRLSKQPDNDDSGQVLNEQFTDELAGQKDTNLSLFSKVEYEIRDEELYQQLERLWKTDFENTEVETKVLVDPKDRDSLRFLWWQNGDLTKELKEYGMVKHLFGAKSSPSVANFCLRKTAQLHQEEFEEEVIETVYRDMYIDDMMRSTSTTEKAISLASQLRTFLEKGGFRLTKWYSNDREVIATISESERAKSVVNLELAQLPTESALGLKWNIKENKFVWEVMEMLQRRCDQPSSLCICDGKGKVGSLREISAPRLELTAAVISVRLSKIIREELDMSMDRVCYWSDSTSVLKCINNESRRFHTFESIRLTVIRNGSKPSEWRYVNRDDNPADDGSKELQVAEREIFKRVQQVAFLEVIDLLSATECCEDKRYSKKVLKKAGASIRRLNTQTKEGLLRVGGRLVNAPFGDERKHPIILPHKHHRTDLIIKHCRENLGHMGQESVLSSLRETVWIVKGISAVRRVLRRCMTCQRQKSACPGEQFMADLPEMDARIPSKLVRKEEVEQAKKKLGENHVRVAKMQERVNRSTKPISELERRQFSALKSSDRAASNAGMRPATLASAASVAISNQSSVRQPATTAVSVGPLSNQYAEASSRPPSRNPAVASAGPSLCSTRTQVELEHQRVFGYMPRSDTQGGTSRRKASGRGQQPPAKKRK